MGRKAYKIRPKRKIVEEENFSEQKKHEKEKINLTKTLSRQIEFTLFTVFLVCILALTGSYAIFTTNKKADNYNSIKVGTLKVDFSEKSSNNLDLNGAYPISDSEGIAQDPYIFKITNTGSLTASYKVRIIDDLEIIQEDNCQNNLLSHSAVRISVNGSEAFTLGEKQATDYVVDPGVIAPNETKEYRIRIWIKDSSGNEVLGKHYHGKIVVDSVNLNT